MSINLVVVIGLVLLGYFIRVTSEQLEALWKKARRRGLIQQNAEHLALQMYGPDPEMAERRKRFVQVYMEDWKAKAEALEKIKAGPFQMKWDVR